MRKIFLGSTAVVAVALFAPDAAMAQTVGFADRSMAPAGTSMRGLEIRIGGYYRAMYNYTDQDGANNSTARLGKSDFSNEIEIHVLASGKAANGLQYGVALEIENDVYRTPGNVASGASATGKNSLGYDEAWAYLAGDWGQIRFGEEDGALAQLQSGHITGFGLGGLDSGDLEQQVIGANNRAAFNSVNLLLDNTKIIYLTPQFFGFDAGVSLSPNTGEGPLSGCDSLATANLCDRVSALSTVSPRRRNEVQAALRWRGSFGPVGVAATLGYVGADAVKNLSGPSPERLSMIWAGAVATAYGFTLGGWYTGGDALPNYNMLARRGSVVSTGQVVDDRKMDSYLVGATYNIDAITVGAHFSQNWSAGDQANRAGLRTTGLAVGGNYRLAPGLDLFAEYSKVERKERGVSFNRPNDGSAEYSVVLAGFRVAF